MNDTITERNFPSIGDIFDDEIINVVDFQEGGIFYNKFEETSSSENLIWEKDENSNPINPKIISEEDKVKYIIRKKEEKEKLYFENSRKFLSNTISILEKEIEKSNISDEEKKKLKKELETRKEKMSEIDNIINEDYSFLFLLEFQPSKKELSFPNRYIPLEKKVISRLKKSPYKFINPLELKEILLNTFNEKERCIELYTRILFYLSKCNLNKTTVLLSVRLKQLTLFGFSVEKRALILANLNKFMEQANR